MHHEPDPGVVSRRTRQIVTGAACVLGVLTLVGLVTLWPDSVDRRAARRLGLAGDVFAAHVTTVTRAPCMGTTPEDGIPCQRVRFRLDQGPNEGEARSQEFTRSASVPRFAAGDEVVLAFQPGADPGFDYYFADRERRPELLWLAVAFGVVVIVLGRWRGVAALVGLGASIAVVLVFVLPALLNGESPVTIATVGASAIAFIALYLAHGFRTMTSVALLGTLLALGVTIGLATLFTELTQLSGFASEESFLVQIGTRNLDVQGLVLAGMVLGALGALDDVTVTQASAIWELRAAEPSMPRRTLYRAGLRIGRDHVASTVNTLALAYVGASLPLLIIFVLADQSLSTIANSEVIATEIIRTLVGSIGLVLAVPITTGLAARLAPNDRPQSRSTRPRRMRSKGPPPVDEASSSSEVSLEDQFWKQDGS
ncbi:MAG: YibE/F family protein [Acidimicrobiia bacterium]